MKFGVNTFVWGAAFGPADVHLLPRIKERGFDGVELPVLEPATFKADIIRRGTSLGVDYSLTHSCYDPDVRGFACGHCDSCILRKRGFEEAGVQDPTVYLSS